MRWLIVTTTLFLCSPGVFAQERAIREAVSRELAVLKSLTGADQKVVDQIKSATEPIIIETVKRQNTNIEYAFRDVPPAIFEVILTAGKKKLAGNPKLGDYKKDQAARRKFRQRATADSFLLQLDRAVELRKIQWPVAKRVVDELAKQQVIPSVFDMANRKLSSKGMKALSGFLTKEQTEFWNKNFAAVRVVGFSSDMFQGDVNARKEKLRTKLRNVAAARIAWLRDELKLKSAQIRKLEVAAKGAISHLIDERIEAEEVFAKMFDGAGFNFQRPEARLAMADASTLLCRFSRWQQLMDSVLNEDQKQILRKLDETRAILERECYNNKIVLSLSRGLTLNAQQLIGFARLVDEFVPPTDASKIRTPTTGMAKVLEIDEARFARVIGEENWPKLKQQLDRMKATFRAGEEE